MWGVRARKRLDGFVTVTKRNIEDKEVSGDKKRQWCIVTNK